MTEGQILGWIRQLTDEKDGLRVGHRGRPPSQGGMQRITEIELGVDLAWAVVRERRARRAAGQSWEDLDPRANELVQLYGGKRVTPRPA